MTIPSSVTSIGDYAFVNCITLACSNGRHYDDGILIFNLALPGEAVTMTAIWE